MGSEKTAVILLSGGLDSAVTAYKANSEGRRIHALTVLYGQRHQREVDAAKQIAARICVDSHKVVEVDASLFEGSSLTDCARHVPFDRLEEEILDSIPTTYVPARNAVMLALALSYAESLGAQEIYLGAHTLDYSGYPDCRPEFIDAFQRMADLATKSAVEGNPIKICTPLINLDKGQIIRLGIELNVPFELTSSCYVGGDKACGRCDSCRLRLKGFSNTGVEDPIEYETEGT